MSITDYGNDKVKNSIDLIRSRIRQKKQSAIDLFEGNEDKQVEEKADRHISGDITEAEIIRDFKVIHNEIYTDKKAGEIFNDSAKYRDKNKCGLSGEIIHVPIVRKIILSKGL
ncbi:MAG: hypothetical protein PQ612_04770 [Rickettsiales bacterium]|nr:hypothetical protein [Pseudomonadota bacterium]MDA0966333.1 hypothetical protein [Pseudomonadota bacterium]MDG4543965.1 hypothetical protein [Rickettsiales bacterium]MDG4545459.1 hypothetical protein [Rickettsiales bacterium]MDG4547908.1 hypothetical protein [Rickettsiales bacterium]